MTTSLSIDSNSLRIVSSSGKKIEKWGSISFDPHFLKEGIISNTAGLAEVLKQALTEKKLSKKNIRCSVPSIGSTSQILTLPQIGKTKLEVAVQREARKAMSVSLETSYLYWQLLPEGGAQKRVYAVAIPKDSVQSLIGTCHMAGVSIASIDLKSLALARAVNQKNAIIANGELDSIEMVIMVDSLPSLMRGVWLREKNLDTNRVTALLLQQLASTIEYYNDMNRANPLPADIPIYLTGEVTLDPELAQRVSAISGRLVATLEPSVTCPPDFPVALYMTNVGLILKSS